MPPLHQTSISINLIFSNPCKASCVISCKCLFLQVHIRAVMAEYAIIFDNFHACLYHLVCCKFASWLYD